LDDGYDFTSYTNILPYKLFLFLLSKIYPPHPPHPPHYNYALIYIYYYYKLLIHNSNKYI